MTLLKRHLAPIDDEVWDFIEEEARTVLKQKLNGRRIVDIDGPKGMDYAAYNTGRSKELSLTDQDAKYSVRDVLPLVEVEVPFTLKIDEIEALLRGAKDVDIDSLIEAAEKVSSVENNALYYGIEEAGIDGLLATSEHVQIDLNEETGFLAPITSAVQALKKEDVSGPYNFVVGPYLYALLYNLDENGYPLKTKIQNLIEGEIIFAEELGDQGLLLGSRDEDFELILGQDISIGFREERNDEIEFFLTESFTFKVNAPEAVVIFKKA